LKMCLIVVKIMSQYKKSLNDQNKIACKKNIYKRLKIVFFFMSACLVSTTKK